MKVEVYHVVLKGFTSEIDIEYIDGPFSSRDKARNKVEELKDTFCYRNHYFTVMGQFIELHETPPW